jgi:hypothetical protein
LSAESPELNEAVWRNYELTNFSWSGENDHGARMAAAFHFAELCKRLVEKDPRARIHVVAHSHGGNVLLQAIERLLEPAPEDRREWTFGEAFRWRFRAWPRLLQGLCFVQTTVRAKDSDTVSHLGRLVFLGTPFLRKQWTVYQSRVVRLADRVLRNVVGAYVGNALAFYPTALAFAGLAAMIPGVPFIGFNPLAWPVAVQALAGLAVLILGTLAVGDEPRFNTNLYFAEHGEVRRPVRPLDSLVVSAEYLDEALLALSAEPLIETEVAPRIDAWIYPDLRKRLVNLSGWVRSRVRRKAPRADEDFRHPFERYRSITGRYHNSFMAGSGAIVVFLVRLPLLISRLVLSVVGAIPRSLVRDWLVRMVTDTATATIHGLPIEEVRGARIDVSSRIGIDAVFAEQHLDVSAQVLDARRATSLAIDATRYGFLTNAAILKARRDTEVESAGAWLRLEKRLPDLYRRYAASGLLEASLRPRTGMTDQAFADRLASGWFVAMERFRELNGSVELFHATYYSDPAVIQQIARFIASGEGPTQGTSGLA